MTNDDIYFILTASISYYIFCISQLFTKYKKCRISFAVTDIVCEKMIMKYNSYEYNLHNFSLQMYTDFEECITSSIFMADNQLSQCQKI